MDGLFIDDLPIKSMVDLSMACYVSHNQRDEWLGAPGPAVG